MTHLLSNLTEAERWAFGLLALLVVGAIVQWLNHFWAGHRSRSDKFSNAASTFRAAVQSAVAAVPPASKGWGDETVVVLPGVCQSLGLAVSGFAPFLGSKRRRFEIEWQVLQRHCEETIPNALSLANRLYWSSSGGHDPAAAKEKFYVHVRKLLDFAPPT